MKKRKIACTTSQKPRKATGFKKFPNRLLTLGDKHPIHQEVFKAFKKGATP